MIHSNGYNPLFTSATNAFEYLFDKIMSPEGQKYAGNTRALFNQSFTLVSPWAYNVDTSWRKWKEDYAKLEYEWYKSGDRNPGMVEKVAKLWSTMKDDQGYVNSNYGAWWQRNDQLERMINELRTHEESRRGIVVHYNPDEVQDYEKDTPCNVVLNFYTRDHNVYVPQSIGKTLNLTIYARSIDLVFGFCNDQYCFARLLHDVAWKLGLNVGSMHYFITNLHVYEKHYNLKTQLNLGL